MGFYIRKSVKAGPLRFNLSKSGIGVSVGVPGFRVGTGPRGNYVHVGARGLYYRKSLVPTTQPRRVEQRPPQPAGPPVQLQPIGSGCITQMIDWSAAQLLQEINEKLRKGKRWPVVAAISAGSLVVLAALKAPVWLLLITVVIAAVGIYVSYQYDELRTSVVLFYELGPQVYEAYGVLHACAEEFMKCAKAWHVNARGDVQDPKYHAGASHLLGLNRIVFHKRPPSILKTNIEPFAIPAGPRTLYFFPDLILVFAPNGVGAVSYRDLRISFRNTRMIEEGPVPHDAQVVDHTWRYVNKKGGPDRRFKDNPQLPICLYEEITFSSASGLNEVIQLSRTGIADGFRKAVEYMASEIPTHSVR